MIDFSTGVFTGSPLPPAIFLVGRNCSHLNAMTKGFAIDTGAVLAGTSLEGVVALEPSALTSSIVSAGHHIVVVVAPLLCNISH